MSNQAVAVLTPGSGDESFMKTLMTNKVRKILDRLKQVSDVPQSPLGYLGKMEHTYS
jgi:hypothetical protein